MVLLKVMQDIFDKTYNILQDAVLECNSDSLALSGGLDSSILAYLLKDRKINAIAIVTRDFVAKDLTYCQLVAQKFDIPLIIKTCEIDEIHQGIEETIKILRNFNDIEIRNNVIMYLALAEIKKAGHTSIITGDGADEIFAGYNFLLNKTNDDLAKDLKRLARIMHFPSQKLGRSLGITVESPFCSKKVLDFAKTLPVELLVRDFEGKKFGKWVLRKTFEESLPKSIVWRPKAPMQDGAGTQGLSEFFDIMIPDAIFVDKIKQIKEKDGVTIRTKESMHYYEIYRRHFDVPIEGTGTKCPDCHYSVEDESRFCRMCGRFPL
jgi:asparagine synthase (glutamine-hydrolysing)